MAIVAPLSFTANRSFKKKNKNKKTNKNGTCIRWSEDTTTTIYLSITFSARVNDRCKLHENTMPKMCRLFLHFLFGYQNLDVVAVIHIQTQSISFRIVSVAQRNPWRINENRLDI